MFTIFISLVSLGVLATCALSFFLPNDVAAIADRFDFDISSCQTTASSVSGGRLLLQVQCASGDRRLTLNGNGTIADDGYSVTSDVAIKLDSTSIRLTTRTEATRVGDC